MSRRWEQAAGTICAAAIACLAPASLSAAADDAPAQAARDEAGFEVGMLAAQQGDLFRAATIFNRLLQRRPHDPGAYIGLAEVQVRSGHLDEADAWLLRGVAANPRNGDLMHARAHVALLQHHERAAADLLAQAITLDPENPDSRRELAELYAGPLGQPDQALALRQAAAPEKDVAPRPAAQTIVPTPTPRPSADLYYRLGLAASARGNLAEAQQFLQKAMALRPWMGEAQTALWSLPGKSAEDMPPRRAAQKGTRARDKNS